jgi:DNA-binding HxlR family transcriptional regulator
MTAQEIADGLSENTAWALSTMPRTWVLRRQMRPKPSSQALVALSKKGVLERQIEDVGWLYRLTPLGLEVRALLQQKEQDNG